MRINYNQKDLTLSLASGDQFVTFEQNRLYPAPFWADD